METKEEKNGNVLYAINVLRKATIFVKIVPFIYALIFLVCMIPYWCCSEEVLNVIDECFYISPIVCLTFVRLSYIFKLCNWYRLQCCLPMFPLPIVLIDENIYNFGLELAYINLCLTILIFILSLINAYFVFVKR